MIREATSFADSSQNSHARSWWYDRRRRRTSKSQLDTRIQSDACAPFGTGLRAMWLRHMLSSHSSQQTLKFVRREFEKPGSERSKTIPAEIRDRIVSTKNSFREMCVEFSSEHPNAVESQNSASFSLSVTEVQSAPPINPSSSSFSFKDSDHRACA